MSAATLPTLCIVVVVVLLTVGLYGLLTARNLIKILIALQILSKSAVLTLVTAGYLSGRINLGQSLALTAIVADTVVTAIGLALAVQVQRRCGTLDVAMLSNLKR